ncbi:hypothetical protein H2201_007247 [Coniosporium apollinis]|uniref:Succinate dehydrogenase assembly factor 4, mitochondrial n=1 Tax=Coniosporium apollinis TaxID=61459 RepID=A0ABQ9NJE6_9PEZI|nr:hypothetical protein H2201_007247 [Coniosporium apollinis]
MMLPRTLLRRAPRAFLTPSRPFTSSIIRRTDRGDPNPDANYPPSRSPSDNPPHTDKQSSASQDEHLSGDDHPAKQPDNQQQPERTTGFGGQSDVKGGKEGLDERTDKQ